MVISDDLIEAYLKCKTKAYQLFLADPGRLRPTGSIGESQWKIRNDFRHEHINTLTSKNQNVCFIGALTKDQLKFREYQWIINPEITSEDLASKPELLENISFHSQNTNDSSYIPIRLFPSEKINKDHKQLLAFDALVLGESTGQFPTFGKIIYGRQKIVARVKFNQLVPKMELIVEDLRAMLEKNVDPLFALNRHCSECEFESRCRDKAAKDDDLSLLGGISPKEILKLRSKGIFTVTQLSYTFRPRRRKLRSSITMYDKYHYALKALAIREKTTYIAGTPEFGPYGTLVYIDVEGIPEQSFYYLIGVRAVSGNSVFKWSFWANNKSEEKKIWYEFLKAMSSIENPVLLHYGSYETIFFRTMQSRYGDSVDDGFSISRLIKDAHNVLRIIYGHIYFPTYTNGLKDIARHLGFSWSTENPSGLRSLVLRHNWELTNDEISKRELIFYNSDDCEALEYVVKAIMKITSNEDISLPPNVADVDSLKAEWPFSYGKKDFVFPELAYITKCAYWNYQRDRIYVRSNHLLKKVSRKNKNKSDRLVQVNKIISPTRPTKCLSCGEARIFHNGRHHRIFYDLRFSEGGIKRWVTKIIVNHYKCDECGNSTACGKLEATKHRYGWQLLAYAIHNLIELHISQFQLAKILRRSFGLPIAQTTIGNMKRRAAEFYDETFKEIRSTLLQGKLIHPDETHVSVGGKDSYVWVFTSMEEVIYLWSETREAKTAADFLEGFKGVLVTDFYAAYDSIECQQQKCLIHLIRDLNDAVLKEPFNQEMKNLVQEFAELMRKIIATVDKCGLKKYYLKKHIADVEQFYRTISKHKFETASAKKAQIRFKKNRNSLFTFLEFDGVPWNNNNAEHAVKAFGRGIRDIVDGRTSENGINEYLVLLSINQTCEYRGIDFLKFLRSGETRINSYPSQSAPM